MIDEVVSNGKCHSAGSLFGTVLNLIDAVACGLRRPAAAPCLTNAGNSGKGMQLFGSVGVCVIGLADLVGYKDIDTHFAFWLSAVSGKPSEVVVFVNGIELVVSLRIERHTDIDGM